MISERPALDGIEFVKPSTGFDLLKSIEGRSGVLALTRNASEGYIQDYGSLKTGCPLHWIYNRCEDVISKLTDHKHSDVHFIPLLDFFHYNSRTSKKLRIVSCTFPFLIYRLDLRDESDNLKMKVKSYLDKHNSYLKIVGSQMIMKCNAEFQKPVGLTFCFLVA